LGGWQDQAAELHKLSVQQKWSEMPRLVNEEMVHAFAAVGTYADISGILKKRFAGVNRIGFEIPLRSEHDKGVLKEIIQDLHRA
jgi:hypothetical protein